MLCENTIRRATAAAAIATIISPNPALQAPSGSRRLSGPATDLGYRIVSGESWQRNSVQGYGPSSSGKGIGKRFAPPVEGQFAQLRAGAFNAINSTSFRAVGDTASLFNPGGFGRCSAPRARPLEPARSACDTNFEEGTMQSNSTVLARYENFGSVTTCQHGCVHVQLGFTVLTLTEAQFQHLVAMLSDSAANFEFFRAAAHQAAADPSDEADSD